MGEFTHHFNDTMSMITYTRVTSNQSTTRVVVAAPWGLTEGVVLLLDGEGEAAVGAVNAEEDHGDVLGGPAGAPWCVGGAVVRVALLQGQRVVLGAGELVSLQDPAIKYLSRGGGHHNQCACV